MARAQAAGNTTKTIQNMKRDLQSLKDDFESLTQQVESLAGDVSGDVLADVKARLASFGDTVDDIVVRAGQRGREAADAAGAIGGDLVDGVEDSVRERPLMALAIAAGVGFLLSSTMRR